MGRLCGASIVDSFFLHRSVGPATQNLLAASPNYCLVRRLPGTCIPFASQLYSDCETSKNREISHLSFTQHRGSGRVVFPLDGRDFRIIVLLFVDLVLVLVKSSFFHEILKAVTPAALAELTLQQVGMTHQHPTLSSALAVFLLVASSSHHFSSRLEPTTPEREKQRMPAAMRICCTTT